MKNPSYRGAGLDRAARWAVVIAAGLAAAAQLALAQSPGVVSVTAAGDFSLFIRADGSRWGMGQGNSGQFGDGSSNSRATPTQIDPAGSVALIAAGAFMYHDYFRLDNSTLVLRTFSGLSHSAFVKPDGTLWTVGNNTYGQLGDGTFESRTTPVPVVNGTNVVAVSLAGNRTFFLRVDGTLWGCGDNAQGALGDGSTATRNIPIQISKDVQKVSAGVWHTVFIRADRTVWGMGELDAYAGSDIYFRTLTPVLLAPAGEDISASLNFTLLLTPDRSLRRIGWWFGGWPGSYYEEIVGSDVKDFVAGGRHVLFTKLDETLWAIGRNDAGQLGGNFSDRSAGEPRDMIFTEGSGWHEVNDGTGLLPAGSVETTAFAIAAGGRHTVFIKADGSLWGMGSSEFFQIGNQIGGGSRRPVLLAAGTVQPPATPVGLSVAPAAVTETVRVTWPHVIGASGYEIWRSESSSSSGAMLVGIVRAQSIFFDASATFGVPYFYWVKAINGAGPSGFSPAAQVSYAPSIMMPPHALSVLPNGTAIFTVGLASSVVAAAYQWQVLRAGQSGWEDVGNDAHYSGAQTARLKIVNCAVSENGDRYRCVVSNSAGTTSNFDVALKVSGASTDINGDGKADILWRNTSTGEVAAWFMNGSTFLSSASLGSVSLNWRSSGVGDFNGDGKMDLLWRGVSTGQVATWFMTGASFLSSASLGSISTAWQSAGAGDFNQDGNTDLVWRNTSTGQVAVWFMDGSTFVASGSIGSISSDWKSAGVGDFNGDGRADLLWRSTSTGQVAVWFMDGATFRGSASLGYVSLDWESAGVGDFNGDGNPDILWRSSSTGQVAVWFMNGATFRSSASMGYVSTDWKIVQ